MIKNINLVLFLMMGFALQLGASTGDRHPLSVLVESSPLDRQEEVTKNFAGNFLGLVSRPSAISGDTASYRPLTILSYSNGYSFVDWGVFAGQQQGRVFNNTIGRFLEQQRRLLGFELGWHRSFYKTSRSQLHGRVKVQATLLNQSWVNTQLTQVQNSDLSAWLGLSWDQIFNQDWKIRTELMVQAQGQAAFGIGVLW